MKRLIIPLFLIFAVVYGLTQLANENDVFAKSLITWCSYGGCKNIPCTTQMSAIVHRYGTIGPCDTYITGDCADCLVLIAEGKECYPDTTSNCYTE